MKAPANTTFDPKDRTPEEQRRFRNQATGIGETRSASERTGAMRSQAVIDAAPAAQQKCAGDSYPEPLKDGPTVLPATTKAMAYPYRLR